MRLAFVLGPREAPNCTCMQSSRMTEFAIFWLPLFAPCSVLRMAGIVVLVRL